ncbi:MAG: metallopeptidase family protein [Nocardioidaceae bacterium]
MSQSIPARPPSRERHGRGRRGPEVVPPPDFSLTRTPLDKGAVSPGLTTMALPTRRQRFDRLAIRAMRTIEADWKQALSFVELAVEDVPILAPNRTSPQIPLASLVPGTATSPPRIVLFRRPIESRANSRNELEALLLTCLVEQVASFLGKDPHEVHPTHKVTD